MLQAANGCTGRISQGWTQRLEAPTRSGERAPIAYRPRARDDVRRQVAVPRRRGLPERKRQVGGRAHEAWHRKIVAHGRPREALGHERVWRSSGARRSVMASHVPSRASGLRRRPSRGGARRWTTAHHPACCVDCLCMLQHVSTLGVSASQSSQQDRPTRAVGQRRRKHSIYRELLACRRAAPGTPRIGLTRRNLARAMAAHAARREPAGSPRT